MEKFTVFSQDAQDAGLWKKLLQNARKESTIAPYFVVDVAEGCLHTAAFSKLCLPAAVWEKYRKHLTEDVTLEGPDGQKWSAMLALSWESKPCLMHGWRDFAAAFNLALEDQVVFFLLEDSHFLVQVFDAHGNIKPRGEVRNIKHRGEVHKIEDRGEVRNNEAVKTVDTESKSVELGNTQAPGGDEENQTESNLLGKSSAPDRADCAISTDAEEELLGLKRSRKLIRKTDSREEDGFYTGSQRLQGLFNLAQDMKNTATLFAGTSGLGEDLVKLEQSMQETAALHANNLAEGKPDLATTVAEDKNPLQQKRSPSTQVTAGRGVHKRKRRAKGLQSMPMGDEGPETRAKARYNAQVPRHEGKAVKELGAEACPPLSPRPEAAGTSAFKRPKPIKLPKSTNISKRRPGNCEEQDAALAASHEYAKNSINNKFVMQMRTQHLLCGLDLIVPYGFAKAMLLPPERTKVTLFDVTGKTWEVEWILQPREGLDKVGWTRFVKDHRLGKGDVCVFELPDPKVFNISVKIFRAVL